MKRIWQNLFGRKSISEKSHTTPRAATKQPARPYAAVAIKINPANCCPAAKRLEAQRFLLSETPLLRLPDCSNPNCGCSYEHYEDRRQGPRREVGSARSFEFVDVNQRSDERRSARGRRAADLTWAR